MLTDQTTKRQLLWRKPRLADCKLGRHTGSERLVSEMPSIPMLGQVNFSKAVGQGKRMIVSFPIPMKPVFKLSALFERGGALLYEHSLRQADLQ